MNKKDSFYNETDFVNASDERVPDFLSQKILKDMTDYVKPSVSFTAFKYSVFFLFSASLSLFLCPQKGFGFLETNYPLFFHFLHHNLLMCGIYCGVFFSLLTHGSALFFLNHYERILIKHQASWVSLSLFAVSFAMFMALGEDYYKADHVYSLAWVITVGLIVFGLNRIKPYTLKHVF